MAIKAIYRKYFQKSKIFLYPLLDIKRGSSVIPSETYISWNDAYTTEDNKLVCLYKNRDDDEYINFEKNILLKHNRLFDYIKIDDENNIFIFDFSDLKDDWLKFSNGKYSKFNDKTKYKILNFFDKNSGNYIYISSYLNPKDYYEDYAELLAVPIKILEEVGELCNKPDLDKENLLIKVADLQNVKILE
jgi:hypothetical protein